MITPDKKYRFSLQWGSETIEKKQVGELLERLRNRKSEFIVMAISEYLLNHPEVLEQYLNLQIIIKNDCPKKYIESMVRSIIEEKMAGKEIVRDNRKTVTDDRVILSSMETSDSHVDKMLENLDLFM